MHAVVALLDDLRTKVGAAASTDELTKLANDLTCELSDSPTRTAAGQKNQMHFGLTPVFYSTNTHV